VSLHINKRTISRRALLAGAAATLNAAAPPALTREQDAFLEDLSRRSFLFLWEQADPETGLVRDRALADSAEPDRRPWISSAATGFGLSGLCIAAERGWIPREDARRRAIAALRFYADKAFQAHGWFYHFVHGSTGERWNQNEVSSIDTALLLAGMLTVRQYFRDDSEIGGLAMHIYRRIDFPWMLNGDRQFLSMGWKPETGFLASRWSRHNELGILSLLAIAAPDKKLPVESWHAWERPVQAYGGYSYVNGAPTLFTHQYPHAWIDFRRKRETRRPNIDWFENSVKATRAHRQFCLDLAAEFPGCYSENIWGITASDTAGGYRGWGGPPRTEHLDGTVVPCAAGGSLMIAPDICLPALMAMREKFGERIYKRYGFVDAFHPVNGWTNPDVLGIDAGITLLSAENLRTGNVWKWFGANPEVRRAMSRLFS
jgi:hypothetical protein